MADPNHAGAAMHGTAPQGAIFMGPDNHVMDDAHHAPTWVKVSPFVAMVIGFITALWFYVWNPEMPKKLAETQRPLYLFLLNKWYFDEIYDFLFVHPAKALGGSCGKRATRRLSTVRSTVSQWGSFPSLPASQGGCSRDISLPMPSRWSLASSF
jgi:NADH:ubiquinone oxidoreductase subunit 5 (subunit L)/multisubunit Na+/H+ antiporter MnhA subunit